MTAKRYVVAVFIFVLVLWGSFGVIGGMIIDPYNVFHVDKIIDNGIEPNKHYIKMTYLLKHPDKFNSFMLGASKVGAIHTEKIEGEKCYNMTYSGGVPVEHLANLKTFLENGIHPKKIYMGVDYSSYEMNPAHNPRKHISQPLRCPYEYLKAHPLHFYSMYMNPSMVFSSLYEIRYDYTHDYDYVGTFYQYGAYSPYGRKSNVTLVRKKPNTEDNPLLNETLEAIRAITEICRAENIGLVVFVNPNHHTLYRTALAEGYTTFFKGLAEITEFYNFDGLNDITLADNNFGNLYHYKAEIGDMILKVICNGFKYDGLYEQGFGWKVNKHNIQEFLKLPEISGEHI